MARGAATLRGRATQVQGTPALPNPSEDLKGLIGVIAGYLVQGAASVPLAYPKQLGNLLLARTDFAKLFQQLPQNALQRSHRPESECHQIRHRKNGNGGSDGRALAEGDTREHGSAHHDRGQPVDGSDGVEDVGPDAAREEVGIFEFRASQGVPLPLAEWFDFALGAQRYITRLHGG